MSEQAAVVTWWRFACRKYGVPEEALLRVAGEGAEGVPKRSLRRQGARCGAADLFLAVPCGRSFGLWISLRRRGRRMTPEEKEFFSSMTSLGYDAALCRSRDEAERRIHAYMVQRGETYQKNVSTVSMNFLRPEAAGSIAARIVAGITRTNAERKNAPKPARPAKP